MYKGILPSVSVAVYALWDLCWGRAFAFACVRVVFSAICHIRLSLIRAVMTIHTSAAGKRWNQNDPTPPTPRGSSSYSVSSSTLGCFARCVSANARPEKSVGGRVNLTPGSQLTLSAAGKNRATQGEDTCSPQSSKTAASWEEIKKKSVPTTDGPLQGQLSETHLC